MATGGDPLCRQLVDFASPSVSPTSDIVAYQCNPKDLFDELKKRFEVESPRKSPVNERSGWCTFFEANYILTKQEDWDDLVFYVVWRNKEYTVETFRRDSRNLPLTSSGSVNWEESTYLNLVMHGFEYQVTTVICTSERLPTGKSCFEFLADARQRVYPSVTRRRMDSRDDDIDVSYPKIQFQIDSYSDVFSKMVARNRRHFFGLELIARNQALDVEYVLFAGKVDYAAIKRVHEQRAKPNIWDRLGKSMKSVFNSSHETYDISENGQQFLKMSGPNGSGSAEVAVSLGEPENVIVTNRTSVSDIFEEASPPVDVQRNDNDEMGVAPLSAHLTCIELTWSSVLSSIFIKQKSPDFPH